MINKKLIVIKSFLTIIFFSCAKRLDIITKTTKKKIQKESRRKYQNLSEEEKEIKQKYRRKRYKSLSENKNKC